MGTSAAARARAPGCGCSRSSARVLSPCRSRGTDTPLRPALSRRAVNGLRGHEDNETDSQAEGRGEAAGWEGVLQPARSPATPVLRPQWETFLHCPSGFHLANRRFPPLSRGPAAGCAGSGAVSAARGGDTFLAPSSPRGRE